MSVDTKAMKIGTYLVHKGLLKKEQAQEILNEQNRIEGYFKPRFGRIAVNKGYISAMTLNEAMIKKYQSEINKND